MARTYKMTPWGFYCPKAEDRMIITIPVHENKDLRISLEEFLKLYSNYKGK